MSDPKPPPSDARLAANRANALRSTGPKTDEGKARSGRNALTHGLCARVIEVPDEDPTLLAERFESWKEELNPGGSAPGDYLVLVAARKSIRLDRCHVVHEATAALLARDAAKARTDARMVEVEALVRMLPNDPDLAVRRLRLTPEGCDALLAEWRILESPLVEPPHWDEADNARGCRLLGLASVCLDQAPSPFSLATLHLAEHRAVATKLEQNECPEKWTWKERYDTVEEHEYDRSRVGWLADRAEQAVARIREVMAEEVARLLARRAELLEAERPDAEEATYRARFDTSEAGKLLRRYEADAERGLFRAIKEARELNKSGADPGGRTPAQPARNEPIARPASVSFADLLASPIMPFSAVPGPLAAPGGPRHKH